MHPEMEPNYSKQRLIFRPKSLLLGWWGGMHPPIPPLNPPLGCCNDEHTRTLAWWTLSLALVEEVEVPSPAQWEGDK